MRAAGAVLVAALAVTACKRGESPEDRTVRKLKEAMEHPAPMGLAFHQNPTEHLAEMATGQQKPGVLALTGTGASAEAGPLRFQLTGAAEQQAVGEGEVTLTSNTPFVRIALSVGNDGDDAAGVDLEEAALGQGKERSGIAPDAQHLAGTRNLKLVIEPHASRDVVLFFEAPALQPPFQLILPKPGGGEVQLPVR